MIFSLGVEIYFPVYAVPLLYTNKDSIWQPLHMRLSSIYKDNKGPLMNGMSIISIDQDVYAKSEFGSIPVAHSNGKSALVRFPFGMLRKSINVESIKYSRDNYLAISATGGNPDEVVLGLKFPEGEKTFIWSGKATYQWSNGKGLNMALPVPWEKGKGYYLGQCRLATACWFGDGILVTSGGLDEKKKLFLAHEKITTISNVSKDLKLVKSVKLPIAPKDILAASHDLKWLVVRKGCNIDLFQVESNKSTELPSIHRVLGVSSNGDIIGVVRKENGVETKTIRKYQRAPKEPFDLIVKEVEVVIKKYVYQIVVIKAMGKIMTILDTVNLDTMSVCPDGKVVYVRKRNIVCRDSKICLSPKPNSENKQADNKSQLGAPMYHRDD